MKNKDNLDIKTHLPDISLPQASLYKINPEVSGQFLVETDPRFTQKSKWLSSDYMFKQLRNDPQNMLKRLGDGFYEQRLVNEQINQLTGRRFLENYSSDYDQYKALMDNGAYYAQKMNLVPGVALTSSQMKELTSDMVWMVKREVTLKDGSKKEVLVPQVYVVGRNTDIDSRGAVISANDVIMNIKGDVQNSGVISGRNLTGLAANNIENLGGRLQGRELYLVAKNMLNNLGGELNATDHLVAQGKHINIESTTSETENTPDFYQKSLTQQASVKVGNDNKKGSASFIATENITVKGANVDVNGNVVFSAGKALNFGTVETENKEHYVPNADNYYKLDQKQEVGSQLNVTGNLDAVGKSAVEMRGVSVTSNGTMNVLSDGNINIQEARYKEQLSSASKSKSRGLTSSTTEVYRHKHDYDVAEASNLDADKIYLHSSKGNVTIQGSNVAAGNGLTVKAKNIDIREAENRVYSDDYYSKKKSGILGGGIGVTFGSQKQTTESDQTKLYAKGSQVGSLNGNTTMIAENTYTQTASKVSAIKDGDVNILAKKVDIKAADDKYETNTKQKFEQKGLTIAISSPVISAIQAVQGAIESTKQVGDSKHDRVNTMSAANAGFEAYRAYQSGKKAVTDVKDFMNGEGDVDSLIGVQITYGQQKSESHSHTEGKTAYKSQVNAGGKVNIMATGAGKDSNINIEGSDISGKQGTTLIADNQVNIKATEQNHQERSTNKSSGFNAGVAIKVSNGEAAGVTVGGNYGKGYGNGDETTYVASHVGDSQSKTVVKAGGDVTLAGSQVKGKGVELDAENLKIESLQDKSSYRGKQMNASASVTVGYGFAAGGSFNKSKVNTDYASVNEQAGIFAGNDGYDINVKNKVSSIGGAIISSAPKEKNQMTAQDFEYSNIQNYSNAKSSAMGLMGGFSVDRDQTSDEDKALNKTYRGEDRKGETFEQANPNKANQLPVKFGLGTNDVHSTDLYAAAKIGLANLASYSSQSENNQSITNAVISDGNFNIASIQGKQNIETIKKSTEQDANKLEKADHAKMQKEVEQDVATIQSFTKNVGGATDEAYRTMFIAEHRMFTHKVDEKGNPIKDPEILKKINEEADAKGVSRKDYLQEQLDKGRNIYQLHELSDQERNQLQKVTYTDPKTGKTESKYVVAFNGIFNDRNSAAKFAVQNYIAGRDDKTGNINQKVYKDVYFVHHPKAKNGLSELLVAGYEKMFEGSFGNVLGMDNSSLQAMNMMKQYGKDDLYLGSHSRGTLTLSNALKALNTEDNQAKKLLSGTTIKMVGPAADVTRADGYLSQLQTGKERTTSDGSIRIENHASDPVGSMPILLGGNPATTSENNLNKSWLQRTADMFSDERLSVHNCHGLGQQQCVIDGYRTKGDLKMGNERTIFELNKAKEK
ncbi:MAG: hemagglutinin repeat-containing protein [Haemophilus parainfluenzae]|nr:hemagglutinin repeat-containing protein [Haemophilus parainfluenzae]